MEGLEAFEDMMQNTKVKNWYRRMERASLNHEGRKWAAERREGQMENAEHFPPPSRRAEAGETDLAAAVPIDCFTSI